MDWAQHELEVDWKMDQRFERRTDHRWTRHKRTEADVEVDVKDK